MNPAKATLLDKFMNEGEPWNFNNNQMHICSLCATCSTLVLFSMSSILPMNYSYIHHGFFSPPVTVGHRG